MAKTPKRSREIEDALKHKVIRKSSDVAPINRELGELLKAKEALDKALERYEAKNKDGNVLGPDDPIWNVTERKCPHCKETKTVGVDFGVRLLRGKWRSQGWCRSCRNGKDSHPTRYSAT